MAEQQGKKLCHCNALVWNKLCRKAVGALFMENLKCAESRVMYCREGSSASGDFKGKIGFWNE